MFMYHDKEEITLEDVLLQSPVDHSADALNLRVILHVAGSMSTTRCNR